MFGSVNNPKGGDNMGDKDVPEWPRLRSI